MSRRFSRGFNLLEVLVAMTIGLVLVAAFVVVLQRSRRDFTANESLAHLQESARHALGVMVADIEHAGFYGFAPADHFQLVGDGATLAEAQALRQPDEMPAVFAVAGLPTGAHDCGTNFAVDLSRAVQATDNAFGLGLEATDCQPTGSAGGAASGADTLTLRHAAMATTTARAGRIQVYSTARSSTAPLLLFTDGRAPGPVDDEHELRDLEVRSYYIARDSVGRRGWPALRVKSLTESRGAAQFRDEEVMPGVEDLQVELGVEVREDGATALRFVTADALAAAPTPARVIAVRIWLRVRAEVTEPGFRDERDLNYSNRAFTPDAAEARQRRLLIERTVTLRNRGTA